MKAKLLNNFIIGIIIVFLAVFFGLVIAKTGTLSALIIPVLLMAAVLTFFIIKNPELGWFLIIFFLPFERVPTIDISGVNIKINTIIGLITLFAWILALMFSPKKFKVQPNALAIPLIIFVLAMLLSLTQAVAF